MLDSSLFDGMPDEGTGRLVVGFSGGVDSLVLLHLACARFGAARVHALHVNHGLSQASDAWQAHCEQIAGNLDAGFSAIKVSVARKGSIEENAREARYAAFEDYLGADDKLLLAQHADDQVETLLLSLFRGSGGPLPGGMPRTRRVGLSRLYRPLLEVSRAQIEAYASAQGLSWVDDDSNADLDFNRNFLRHRVLPVVESRWPRLRTTLLATLARGREMQSLADSIATSDLVLVQQSGTPGVGTPGVDTSGVDTPGVDTLDVDALLVLPPTRRRNLLRFVLLSLGLPVPGDTLLNVELDRFLVAAPDATPQLHWQGVYLRRFAGRIYLTGEAPTPFEAFDIALDAAFDAALDVALVGKTRLALGAGELTVETGQDVGLRESVEKYQVRPRRGGEKIRLVAGGSNRRLGNVFQEAGVPPWLRDSLPLVFDGDLLVAVAALPAFGVPMLVAASHQCSPGVEISYSCQNQPYSR